MYTERAVMTNTAGERLYLAQRSVAVAVSG